MGDSGTVTKHFNEWPNTAGFDIQYQELEPRDLEVTGTIPSYCLGTLYRNGIGPAVFKTDKKTVYRTNHWFDCLAQVHRFQILPSPNGVRVIHNSRRTCDDLIERVKRTGKYDEYTFAAKCDPCTSFFKKLQSFFTPEPKQTPSSVNIGVTITPDFPGLSTTGAQKSHQAGQLNGLVIKTDSSQMQVLDPETLEPQGIARQTLLHPDLKGAVSAAHAKVCPKTGEIFNFNLDFGRTGTYRAFKVGKDGHTTILANFPAAPAYLHSTFLTEHYFIICIWNSHFIAGGASILWTHNFLDAMTWNSDSARWFVIDRAGKGIVSTFESEPFFCFHTVNAYEEGDDVIADVCAYDDMDVLKRFYLDNIRSDEASYAKAEYKDAKAAFRRFRLPNIKQGGEVEVLSRGDKGLAPELPSINHSLRGQKYQYAYGVSDTGKSTFLDGLVKYDVQRNEIAASWSEHGQTAGEPIFIADPDRDDEDAGVLLTAVLDGPRERSYLLCLDARNLQELGRATMADGPAKVLGFGFHGAHVASITSEGS